MTRPPRPAPSTAGPASPRLTRRATLQGLGAGLTLAAGGAVAATTGLPSIPAAQAQAATPVATPTGPGAGPVLTPQVLAALRAAIPGVLADFAVPGLGVALVEGTELVFADGFGVADSRGEEPVSAETRFRLASNTKSMTALLVAQQVDAGAYAWDDRVVDLWPAFQAPTPELTASLTVQDLLSMATGLGESPLDEFFLSAGDVDALTAAREIATLPVIASPGEHYAYNNRLYALAGYLHLLQAGVAPDDLAARYALDIQSQLMAPSGMATASIASDPWPQPWPFATGHCLSVFAEPEPLPFISVDGLAPAASAIASATDMAHYLIMQMNQGVAADGAAVVPAAGWAVNHTPGIVVPPDDPAGLPSPLLTETASLRYAQGWFVQTFTNNVVMHWHAGGIDGFASLMGFFPETRVGYVFLTNQDPGSGGAVANLVLQSVLLGAAYGVNAGLPDLIRNLLPPLSVLAEAAQASTSPVDIDTIQPYLGLYSDGFHLALTGDGALELRHDIRRFTLLTDARGGYVVTNGPGVIRGQAVSFSDGPDGAPVMTIGAFPPVRWLTGD